MMKVQRRKYTLFWLIKPEDSTNWEERRIGDCTNNPEKRESIYSILKLLFWYTMAIVVAIFLSRLH